MNPRIASIENLIASDPGGRNVFSLLVADQVRLAAQSLRLAKRVGIVSGFYVREAGAGETDGPPGAKVVGAALEQLGIPIDYITDKWNAPIFRALGLVPVVDPVNYLDDAGPTHLVSIERAGRGSDGRYHNMHGDDITDTTAPLDELFLEATRRGLTTIGIGDGGNEIGMGKVFAEAYSAIDHGPHVATTVPTDFCIAAGVSNWGAYGLAGALSVLEGRDLMPSARSIAEDIEKSVDDGGGVDGVTHRREATVDGLEISHSVRMLENIRRQTAQSPLQKAPPLRVGVLGYGEAGRAATALLVQRGHRVRISDQQAVTLEPGIVVDGVETGQHTVEFLGDCDLVVASPGVRADAAIRNELHSRGVPVMSELEMAYQLCDRELIAVTGTIGKRTTVELMEQAFSLSGRSLVIGGNRGRPLSALLLDDDPPGHGPRRPAGVPDLAIAVSSFQLETVVNFRAHIAVMLNIEPAHLDRHQTIAEYVRIKSRVFMNQRPDDVLVLSFDDERLRPLTRKRQGRTLYVSCRQEVDRGAWLLEGRVKINLDGTVEDVGPADPPFAEDLLVTVVTCRLCGISTDEIAGALQTLRGEGRL